MPRIMVTDDSEREVVFWERVGQEDFETEHFRRCLADRLGWAVADAEEVREAEEPEQPRHERELEVVRERDPDLVPV